MNNIIQFERIKIQAVSFLGFCLLALGTLSCTSEGKSNDGIVETETSLTQVKENVVDSASEEEVITEIQAPKPNYDSIINALPDTALVNLEHLDSTFVLDVRYATEDNFMKEQVYPCAKCLLRKDAALALGKAHEIFKQKGYGIKLFDCYRPLSVQWMLWNKTTDKKYVANPKYGSYHNRGSAVDLTLIDLNTGEQLPMGTKYDFFGREAHHSYTAHSKDVLENRKLLKSVMASVGFSHINSEWWHYNFKKEKRYRVLDIPLPCDE